jgi:hypothetical protein
MTVTIVPYVPTNFVALTKLARVESAWVGLDRILSDIVVRFNIPPLSALEFGVEFGYSTSALANIFESVQGVDTFAGDGHAGFRADHFRETSERLKEWPNICLHQARYQEWIDIDDSQYNLIHIDIVHTYEDTFACGRWAISRAPCVLFHDTESFPEVKRAVRDIAEDNGALFYNYEPCHGLGILTVADR